MKKLTILIPVALVACLTFACSAKNKVDSARIVKALPKEAFVKPKKERTLLVFSVTNGYHHGSIPTGQAALKMLGEKTGAYKTVLSNDLSNFEPENIAKFDAICFLNTTGSVFVPKNLDKLSADEQKKAKKHAKRLQKSLMKHVKDGAGFVGIHAATDTNYDWPEYGEMIGAYFNGHPWGAGTKVSIKVEPGRENNPLVAHMDGKNLNFKEEIYQFKEPYDSSKVGMLLRLDTEKSPMDRPGINRKDKDFGVSWVRNWGKGRVFYCSLGHNNHIYSNPKVLKLYLGGIQWALGDLKVSE